MAIPVVKILVELPATEAAKACIYLYETANAFWAEQLSPEDEEALRGAIKRHEQREAGDA